MNPHASPVRALSARSILSNRASSSIVTALLLGFGLASTAVTPAHAGTATTGDSAGSGGIVVKETKAAATKLTAKAVGQSKTYKQVRTKLSKLKVKGRAAKTGYSRSKFGQSWADQDRNGCDTRNDILRRDLGSKKYKTNTRKCVVTKGKLKDKYTGTTISFNKSTNASAVQIDHVVALNDAWQKGAQKLSVKERTNLANDPLNLRAAQGKANQQKGASDAASWLPKNKAFRCEYVAAQVDVKTKYRLWVTSAEKAAMKRVLKGCTGKVPQLKAVPALSSGSSGSGSSGSGNATAGVAPLNEYDCPTSAPIKGNQTSTGWKYHNPGGRWYDATKPEACFATNAAAEKAGYVQAQNQF